MLFEIPIIWRYSLWTQLAVISLLFIISYKHRTSRLVISAVVSSYLAYKLLIPLLGWGVSLFKAIAWLGFYLYFFGKATTMAFGGLSWVFEEGLPWFMNEMEKERFRATAAEAAAADVDAGEPGS
ncbi:hypothetical protein FA15DRAFT_443337 [Coprinopsis marcescibilis]|uniref:Uncharacterized protein n=1 Tax=Coprinopsis marcescibilis TaxID=230819 RepID=A0A5C3KTZ9_COPMA|nr:hypothetical protein FA15DRAFT_443337 [Coprinopsis marcescibilis]